MHYMTRNWSFDPFMIIVPLLVIWYEAGLAWLARASFPQDTRRRRLRSLWFYGGLALLLVAVESPVDYWGGRYLFVEMIQDLLLAFAAPAMIMAGAPRRALRYGLPGRFRADLTRELLTGRLTAPPAEVVGAGSAQAAQTAEAAEAARAAWAAETARISGGARAARRRRLWSWLTVLAFNLVVIFWHLPGPLDLAATNRFVHVWLAHLSLVVAGLFYWPNFIGAPPWRPRLTMAWQVVVLLFTAEVISLLAVAMSVLSQRAWYPAYGHFAGISMNPFDDQQLAAATMVACVDFWAGLALLVLIWRLMTDDEGLNAAIDRMIGRDPGAADGPAEAGT